MYLYEQKDNLSSYQNHKLLGHPTYLQITVFAAFKPMFYTMQRELVLSQLCNTDLDIERLLFPKEKSHLYQYF